KEYVALLQESLPKEIEGLSLDRLETSFSAAPDTLKGHGEPLDNTPPRMVFSTKPAVLVTIDGPPIYRPVAGTDLQRVINTGTVLFKDPAGRYYAHVGGNYLTGPALEGPWTPAQELPKGAEAVEAASKGSTPGPVAPQFEDQADQAPAVTNTPPPVLYVATSPTELVIFEGEPNFVPVAGTHLLYVANTTANVFKLLTDQKTYVLLSGRWFRAPSLDGPWEYVPATALAADFASIPDTSPKENVKASVPGTPQSTEALIANSIPQSTRVLRSARMQDPRIDGAPQLKPIPGTPLFYVANSGTPIIKVDDNSWYACQNGVWFASTSVNGPWTVAASIPAVIYSIPPNSPLHYVTYVRVYGIAPEYVYEGYTPGYFGTEIEDGVVVYGTGYYYAPWVGGVWYGWPVTWGWGWGPCWNPWDDWCFGFGFGWGCGYGAFAWRHCHPVGPWWGPYRYWPHGARTVAWRVNRLGTAANLYAGARARNHQVTQGRLRSEVAGRAYNSRTGSPVSGEFAPRAPNAGYPNWSQSRNEPRGGRMPVRALTPFQRNAAQLHDNSVMPRSRPGAGPANWGAGREGLGRSGERGFEGRAGGGSGLRGEGSAGAHAGSAGGHGGWGGGGRAGNSGGGGRR
ncbi:MAG TPA: autotransporter, partial [Verrucomicrobiae bacterium]|nr:autotransporter [Verrucomicrobiae bacterium]